MPTDPLTAFESLLASARSGTADASRLICVFAHPDDEAIALGGHLEGLRGTFIVQVTDGAPRNAADSRRLGFGTTEDYAAERAREVRRALRTAGVARYRHACLGFPDQAVAQDVNRLAERLTALFRKRRPDFIVTHPFEGGHPDHDACALAVNLACRAAGLAAPPSIIEAAFYHLGPDGPVFQAFAGAAPELVVQLDPAAAVRKQRLLDCYATQRQTLAAFRSDVERFRIAPDYDFRQLPNGGRLLYTDWGLGLAPEEWLALARSATVGPAADAA